uniref:MICOS complex subunit MIC13 n=1 Tax=Clastoptera arizonana TaxID=38151 RepID=A0A1B6EAJ6_9HEMI
MQTFGALVFCLLVAVCYSYESTPVVSAVDSIWDSHVDVLRESRRKRETEDNTETEEVTLETLKRRPWCFCGQKRWLANYVTNNKKNMEACIDQYAPTLNKTLNEAVNSHSLFPTIVSLSACSVDCAFKKAKLANEKGKVNKPETKKILYDQSFR